MQSAAIKWTLVLLFLVVLVYLLRPILSPFLIGALLAYLGDPLVLRLQRKGMARTWAVACVFCVMTVLSVMGLLICLPLLGQQVQNLIVKLPLMAEWVQLVLLPMIHTHLGLDLLHLDVEAIRSAVQNSWKNVGDVVANVLAQLSSSSMAFIGFVGNMALVPVVTFYLLKDWHTLLNKIQMILPRHIASTVVHLASECNEVIAAFLRGQLWVMFALGVIYSVGLSLIGVPFAVLIGMLAGIANIVPYLGFIVGIVLALVSALIEFKDWLHPVLVCGVFLAGQAMEGMVLTPWLVGDRIGLHPVAVIFAVLAGAQLFGFVGMLLALPVAAVILVILRYALQCYLQSDMYQAKLSLPSQEEQESDKASH